MPTIEDRLARPASHMASQSWEEGTWLTTILSSHLIKYYITFWLIYFPKSKKHEFFSSGIGKKIEVFMDTKMNKKNILKRG